MFLSLSTWGQAGPGARPTERFRGLVTSWNGSGSGIMRSRDENRRRHRLFGDQPGGGRLPVTGGYRNRDKGRGRGRTPAAGGRRAGPHLLGRHGGGQRAAAAAFAALLPRAAGLAGRAGRVAAGSRRRAVRRG